ncbi:hypothetical protein DSECCO2_651610 [anaerobic digester metagenome]
MHQGGCDGVAADDSNRDGGIESFRYGIPAVALPSQMQTEQVLHNAGTFHLLQDDDIGRKKLFTQQHLGQGLQAHAIGTVVPDLRILILRILPSVQTGIEKILYIVGEHPERLGVVFDITRTTTEQRQAENYKDEHAT